MAATSDSSLSSKNKNRQCLKCPKRPVYNNEGEIKGLYCFEHKEPSMVDVVNPRCLKCSKLPSYNSEGETKALYCFKHKEPGMVDVLNPRCLKCSKRPTFNIESAKKALYCFEHKEPSMVDVVNPRCLKCSKHPSYNSEGEKKALYCFEHKEPGMVNVVSPRCLKCSKHPSYNSEGEKKALYCFEHKEPGMVDIKSRRCLKCLKQPHFNNEGKTKGLYCFEHKEPDMVDVVSPRCLKCPKQPYFNNEGEKKGRYCFEHKEPGMVDVVNARCATPGCIVQISNKKYHGHCLRCFVHLFPDEPAACNYKTKERAVDDFLSFAFPDKTIVFDKPIFGGCSKRRPDAIFDVGTHVIVQETDENQHEVYDCSCENKRICELWQDIGHRPLVFIRFNPDDYFDISGKHVTSCWGIDGRGMAAIKKSKNAEWAQRLNCLRDHIAYWLGITPEKSIEIIQLFYDEVTIS